MNSYVPAIDGGNCEPEYHLTSIFSQCPFNVASTQSFYAAVL
jgi:hypothetical protein